MKHSSKNLLWLFISTMCLLFFVFATLIVGIKFDEAYPYPLNNDLQSMVRGTGVADSFTIIVVGFWATGLAISFISVFLIGCKTLLDTFGVVMKVSNNIWDYIYFGLIVLASICIIIGSSIFIDQVLKTALNAKINAGNAVTLFTLIILPIVFSFLPLTVDWIKKKDKKPKK